MQCIQSIIQKKGNSMKTNKAKEQLIGLTILSSVFVFFIYLKMNPEVSVSSNNENNINKIIEQKVQKVQTEITDSKTKETEEEETKSTNDILVEKNAPKESTKEQSIILFTERELKRAKAYLDKDWRPDNTINMAAWDYVSKNPNINNVKKKQENITLYDESNQVANTLK